MISDISDKKNIHYRNYLFLLLLCLLAYWPLTFGVFSVKNDAIHYFLPFRFNISEALRNGELPFWSPYIYLGYPIYGDMQSGAWNPIVWIFSLFGRYNITLFHYENLLYIFLAGVGMYKLTYHFIKHSLTALLIAASYMLSGFMLSGQLINWLASAAFIPFVLLYYFRTSASNSYANPLKTALALFLLFTAGYPSFFIITCYLLFFIFLIKTYENIYLKENKKKWGLFAGQHLAIAIIFILAALPALISYIDLLPYYQRGESIQYADVIQNSFEWKHMISLGFPLSIKAKNVLTTTDVTCRNIYIGIICIIILFSLPPKSNKKNILLIVLAVFSLLFSLGNATPLRKLCYKFVPLMDTFRHPSQMRFFLILALLLLTAPGLKIFITQKLSQKETNRLKITTITLTIITFLLALFALFKSGFLNRLLTAEQSGFSSRIKSIIESNTLVDGILINGVVQIIFLAFFLLYIVRREKKSKSLILLWTTNLFVMGQLVLPVTFVSKNPPSEINKFIHSSPKGFPVSGLENKISENSVDAVTNFDKIALSYFYNKKIGTSHITNSPSFLTEQENFINSPILYNYVATHPVTYLADTIVSLKDSSLVLREGNNNSYAFFDMEPGKSINKNPGDTAFIKKLASNQFTIETNTSGNVFLVLTQNYHHNWKVMIDGVDSDFIRTNIAFMGCYVKAGKHDVVFRFLPSDALKAVWIQFIFFIILFTVAGIMLYKNVKRNSLK